MNLLYVEQSPVVRVECTQTHFANAMWIPSKSSRNIWLTFLHCWSTVNRRHQQKIRKDRGFSDTSMLFNDLALSNRIKLQLSPVKSHNSNGIWEQYHASLQRIYLVLRRSHPVLTHHMTLCLALKGMNHTDGPGDFASCFRSSTILALTKQAPSSSKRTNESNGSCTYWNGYGDCSNTN